MTPPSAEALAALKDALGPGGWTEDAAEIGPSLTEWRGRWSGATPLMLLPRSTDEVARAVRVCAGRRIPVVTQGGGTGLVGGQVPFGEVLLSTRRLRAIRDVSPLDDALTVEAGVTLLEAQQAAAAVDRRFPLGLASEGTATIGGAVSSNAGGTGVVRYGMMRDLVLGLEAVLPDGEVFHGLKRLRKDNTGYDLKQLLIGAEGTLGVVTAATLKLFCPSGYSYSQSLSQVAPTWSEASLTYNTQPATVLGSGQMATSIGALPPNTWAVWPLGLVEGRGMPVPGAPVSYRVSTGARSDEAVYSSRETGSPPELVLIITYTDPSP